MWVFLKAMLYRIRSGWFFDLWHINQRTFHITSYTCYLHCTSFKRPGSEKSFPSYTHGIHTQEKQDSQKGLWHKGQQCHAHLKITSFRMSRGWARCSSLLWITHVYPPLSKHLLPQEQSCCCCQQTKVVLGFWPEATCFRRKIWPRAEAVAVTFTHLQTENTPYFPTSLHHGKITLETMKWMKSNFLLLPINWC